MRVLVATLALFPLFAAAQNLGTYEITNGTIVPFGQGTALTGDGVSFSVEGYPAPLFSGGFTYGGETDFSVNFYSGLETLDWGMHAVMLSSPSDLVQEGLVPYQVGLRPDFAESGSIATPLIDITQAGTYSVPFTMNVDVYYGAPGATSPAGYIDLVGSGTLTTTVAPLCAGNGGLCPAFQVTSAAYVFSAPEIDPASLSGALTLLGGGLLVLRGRRSRVRITVYPGVIPR
jgi:hypothetical protein